MKINQINNRFKVARINAGYSQRDVSRILKFVSFQALSHYEHELCIPSNKILYALPKLYHVSLDYLLNEDIFRNHNEYIQNKLGLDEKSITILTSNLDHTIRNYFIKNYINTIKTRSVK